MEAQEKIAGSIPKPDAPRGELVGSNAAHDGTNG
jgi:hypothetical protein